jgi:hypothetical protein
LRLFLPAFDSPEVDLRVYRVSPQKQFACRDAAFFHLTASVQLELLLAWKAMSLDELPMGGSLIGEKILQQADLYPKSSRSIQLEGGVALEMISGVSERCCCCFVCAKLFWKQPRQRQIQSSPSIVRKYFSCERDVAWF